MITYFSVKDGKTIKQTFGHSEREPRIFSQATRRKQQTGKRNRTRKTI